MNTLTARFGPGLHALRSGVHLPRRAAPPLVAVPRQAAPLGWLERLALWAERQPMHRHLGSYNRYR